MGDTKRSVRTFEACVTASCSLRENTSTDVCRHKTTGSVKQVRGSKGAADDGRCHFFFHVERHIHFFSCVSLVSHVGS